MSSKIWLSKSTYLKGLQCPKALYLHKYQYTDRDPIKPELQALFDDGHDIENLARKTYFPGGMNLKPKSPRQWPKVIQVTEQLLKNGQGLLYEAAFAYKGVMCAVDVFKNEPDGTVSIFEIKRSKTVKDVFIEDMAIQYWIVNQLGYQISGISLVQPTETKELDFKITDFTSEILKLQELIPERLNDQSFLINNKRMPLVKMGEQCNSPYKCSFHNYCTNQEMAG